MALPIAKLPTKTTQTALSIEVVKQYPGPVQVTRRVKVRANAGKRIARCHQCFRRHQRLGRHQRLRQARSVPQWPSVHVAC